MRTIHGYTIYIPSVTSSSSSISNGGFVALNAKSVYVRKCSRSWLQLLNQSRCGQFPVKRSCYRRSEMFDSILGRGFSSKCKSLIKATRSRIELSRRRAEAKQRVLKEDLAKLIANGLDVNAYGRTEEYVAGERNISCYGFIELSCEIIMKQLSNMQKQSNCPEESREAVASLMFAAARFSDLPELRDLRDLILNRYGSGLECFVNQKFVEQFASRTTAMEKRIQLLQDIASEFQIQWDSAGFQQRLACAEGKLNTIEPSRSAGNYYQGGQKGSLSKSEGQNVFSKGKQERQNSISDDVPRDKNCAVSPHRQFSSSVDPISEKKKATDEGNNNNIMKSYHGYGRPPPYVKSKDKTVSHGSSSSVRRMHHHNDEAGNSEATSVVNRRREHTKTEHSHRDEEERAMDKLLLHYSRKPSEYDIEKLRKKPHKTEHDLNSNAPPHPARSLSLPNEQATPSETTKVYTRANSFQPEQHRARHVHPKLPDYDDLAARFAAMRKR